MLFITWLISSLVRRRLITDANEEKIKVKNQNLGQGIPLPPSDGRFI